MHLMNAQTKQKVTINRKEKINCVQMYLKFQYVSEISTIDRASFVMGILEGDNYQLKYQTTLTNPQQKKTGKHSWLLWKSMLKMLATTPKATLNKLLQRLGPWIETNSESEKWLLYQEQNGSFYTQETHKDTEWKIYKRFKTGHILLYNYPEKFQKAILSQGAIGWKQISMENYLHIG